jgi:hypothetical protein
MQQPPLSLFFIQHRTLAALSSRHDVTLPIAYAYIHNRNRCVLLVLVRNLGYKYGRTS